MKKSILLFVAAALVATAQASAQQPPVTKAAAVATVKSDTTKTATVSTPVAISATTSVSAAPATSTQKLPAVATAPVTTPVATTTPAVEATPAVATAATVAPTLKRGVKYDRGLDIPSAAFVKKGLWNTGLMLSHSQLNMDEYKFVIVDDIGLKGYTLDMGLHLGYVFRDNMMLGARFSYDRTSADVGNASLVLGDLLNTNLTNVGLIKHSYSGILFYRYYMGLGRTQRFAFFTEVQLGLGGSQAQQTLSATDGVYETSFDAALGLSPGIMAFITNNVALEVSVNLLGLKYSDVEQVSNQVSTGHRSSSSLNCKINLLSLGLGLSFYL